MLPLSPVRCVSLYARVYLPSEALQVMVLPSAEKHELSKNGDHNTSVVLNSILRVLSVA
jgi:hypothetical protein